MVDREAMGGSQFSIVPLMKNTSGTCFFWYRTPGMPTLKKGLQYFKGWKKVFWMKNSIFTCCAIHMCSNKLEKKQYFPKSCNIFEVFSLKKQYKILQKSNTWHLWNTIKWHQSIQIVRPLQMIAYEQVFIHVFILFLSILTQNDTNLANDCPNIIYPSVILHIKLLAHSN